MFYLILSSGEGPVDCDEDDLESTRAESWGQIVLQTLINIIYEQFGVISGKIDVYGDNKDSLVKNHLIPSKMAFPRFFKPNVDIKLLLQRLRDDSPQAVEILPGHVNGYQDQNTNFDYNIAPQLVKRNIDMDLLSKKFSSQTKEIWNHVLFSN